MKISRRWLQTYVTLDAPDQEIAHAVTFLGFEVEQVIATGAPRLDGVVVGEVLTRLPHPNADKLSVCTVDVGPAGGVKTIVCGAQNYQVGDRVPVALPGAVLPGNFAIKQSKIRGQLSDGMMCSGREIGIGDDHSGLLILPDRPALGTAINEVLPPGDTIFDLEITPNRPDCLSHLGIARELAAWFDRPLAYPQSKFRGEVPHSVSERPDLLGGVRVNTPGDCPLYTAHLVTGVTIGPSPAWLQERLRSVGLRPINNVVDITNFVMFEYGQPLHAFDSQKLEGRRIEVRRASEGEKIVTLDGKERILNPHILVIADGARPVVIAGIMGGENSGVSETTTDLVLECAVFKGHLVRRASRHLALSSDSSYRYERGVDPHLALEAAYRALDLIVEIAGGMLVGPIYRIGGDIPWKREIALTTGFVRNRLGFEIPEDEMKSALESLELKIVHDLPADDGGRSWTVSIPSWRDDLDRPIDLVEEILRLHGTDQIPAAPLVSPTLVVDDDPTVRFNRRAAAYLVGHDFHECLSYTLRAGRELTTWVSEAAASELAVANPLVEDQSHLRPTLVLGLLDALKLNQSRGVPVSRLFETGRIFLERDGQIFECAAVAFVIADDAERRWHHREPADFYTTKHHVMALAAAAGVSPAGAAVGELSWPRSAWQEGHSAEYNDLPRGWFARFGLLNLALVKSLGLTGKVYAGFFGIFPERLAAAPARRRYADFSLFPVALRDLALVVPAATPAAEVERELTAAARAATGDAFAVESVTVFDVFTGGTLAADQKSLAFSFVFRASDRTLKDEEVAAVMAKVQEQVRQAGRYQVRE